MRDKVQKVKIKSNLFYTILTTVIVIVLGILIFSQNDTKEDYPWYIYETNTYELFDEYKGEGIVIAFLDSGMDIRLQEIYGDRVIKPYNFVDDNSNVDDVGNHGTSIICIATCDYDLTGIYGIAPKAKVMPITVMDEDGLAEGDLVSKGIYYAVDHGANIINLSFGSRIDNDVVNSAIEYALFNNVVVVAAVGDFGDDNVLSPANYENTIAIQAQSKLGVKYLWASTGPEVDYMVPGELIETIQFTSGSEFQVVTVNGSSAATAIFSGILALKLQYNNEEYFEDLGDIRFYFIKEKFINFNDYVRK